MGQGPGHSVIEPVLLYLPWPFTLLPSLHNVMAASAAVASSPITDHLMPRLPSRINAPSPLCVLVLTLAHLLSHHTFRVQAQAQAHLHNNLSQSHHLTAVSNQPFLANLSHFHPAEEPSLPGWLHLQWEPPDSGSGWLCLLYGVPSAAHVGQYTLFRDLQLLVLPNPTSQVMDMSSPPQVSFTSTASNLATSPSAAAQSQSDAQDLGQGQSHTPTPATPNRCFNKYPVTLNLLLQPNVSFFNTTSYLSLNSNLHFVQFFIDTVFRSSSQFSSPPTAFYLSSREFLLNHKLQCQGDQTLQPGIFILSFTLPTCTVECPEDASELLQSILIGQWRYYAELTVVGIFLSQFEVRPTVLEMREFDRKEGECLHVKVSQAVPWRIVRRDVSGSGGVDAEAGAGSGFIEDTPSLQISDAFTNQLQKPQGRYFQFELTPNMILQSGRPATLSDYQIQLIGEKKSPDFNAWIFWNDTCQCIQALPLSAQEGLNNFYIKVTNKNNPVSSLSLPLEILVYKNKNKPNHRFGFEFKYEFNSFHSNILLKVDVMRKIAVSMGKNVGDLTIDRYSSSDTTDLLTLWVFLHTIPYQPCNLEQIALINTTFSSLAESPVFDKSAAQNPNSKLQDTLSAYNLQKVRLEYLEPCLSVVTKTKNPDNSASSDDGASIVNEESEKQEAEKSEDGGPGVFSYPVVIVVLIGTLALVLVVVFIRYRQTSSSCRLRKQTSEESFVGVKTRNVPVVFADELDHLSSNGMSKSSSYRPVPNGEADGTTRSNSYCPAVGIVGNSTGGGGGPQRIEVGTSSGAATPRALSIITNNHYSLPVHMGNSLSIQDHSPKYASDSPRSSSSNSFLQSPPPPPPAGLAQSITGIQLLSSSIYGRPSSPRMEHEV